MQKIGHRGAKGYVVENTIASIGKALELKVDAIEVDVHVCKTGEVVVIHDEKINRTTSGKGKVRSLTYKELLAVASQENRIPTLKEVLSYCKGKCVIHIELKGKGTAIKVAGIITEAIEAGQWTYDELFVSSFVSSRLKKIKKYNPKIQLGIITAKKASKAVKHAVKKEYEAVYIYHEKLEPHLVRIAKLKNLKIYAWTLNDPKKIEKMKRLDIEGIITDFPDRV